MDSRPSGIVAFLFTDIEGSSRRWEEDRDATAAIVEAHDRIITAAVGAHGGVVFSSAGDSFAAAFHTVSDAVGAALEAQHGLAALAPVRMAVHIGPALQRDGDYFGPTLNRCGRLRDAAHGGQVICSQAVADLLADHPVAVDVTDLGEHRLKDLSRPEHVFQLSGVGLGATVFPALSTLTAELSNLPIQVTSFIGRHQETAEIEKALHGSRLVTLTGAGGCGKSRLGLEVAAAISDEYPDGVWMIELTSTSDPALVPQAVAAVFGVQEHPGDTLSEAVVNYLKRRRLLLVLDNCEHLLDPAAQLVSAILSGTPNIDILATSREPLHTHGETIHPVPPLPLPEPGAALVEVAHTDAIRLFTERAAAATPDFHLNTANAQAVSSICRHLDGIPLAIELAAATTRMLGPDQIDARLDDRFRLLRHGPRGHLTHHQTLQAAIEWSWDLLTKDEQILFGRLSVFRGTWSLQSAETICGFEPLNPAQVIDLLTSLVDKSLVAPADSARFRLLESLRHFAALQLGSPGSTVILDRLVGYWRDTLAGTYRSPRERVSAPTAESFVDARALEPDRANLNAAMEWALESGRFEDAMAILGSAFGAYLWLNGGGPEALFRWVDSALLHRDEISSETLAKALDIAAVCASFTDREEAWLTYLGVQMELAVGDAERHRIEISQALATSRLGRVEEAAATLERVVAESGDPAIQASALLVRAEHAPPRVAWQLVQRALELRPSLQGLWLFEDIALWWVGRAARRVGHYETAREFFERSGVVARAHGSRYMQTVSAMSTSMAYGLTGRLDEAVALLGESLPLARGLLGTNPATPQFFLSAAEVARLQGDHRQARAYVDEGRSWCTREDQAWLRDMLTHQEALVTRDEGDLEQALVLLSEVEDVDELQLSRAGVQLRLGRSGVALESLQEALTKADRLRHRHTVQATDTAAIAFSQLDKPRLAALLMGAVDSERETTGLALPPPDRELRQAAVRRAQARLGDEWDLEVTSGRSLSLDEAIEVARGEIASMQARNELSACGRAFAVAVSDAHRYPEAPDRS